MYIYTPGPSFGWRPGYVRTKTLAPQLLRKSRHLNSRHHFGCGSH